MFVTFFYASDSCDISNDLLPSLVIISSAEPESLAGVALDMYYFIFLYCYSWSGREIENVTYILYLQGSF